MENIKSLQPHLLTVSNIEDSIPQLQAYQWIYRLCVNIRIDDMYEYL